MQSNHTVQADTLRERSLSLARRLLAGAGRASLVAYDLAPLVEAGALSHGLSADGDLVVACLADDAVPAEAAQALHADGLSVAVVSMPSWELFDAQPEAYRKAVLGEAPRIAIEAAGKFGWTRYVATEDDVIGMTGFGASAPAPALYKEFGITPEATVAEARRLLG